MLRHMHTIIVDGGTLRELSVKLFDQVTRVPTTVFILLPRDVLGVCSEVSLP